MKFGSQSTRVRFIGLSSVLVIGVAGMTVADAGTNTPAGGTAGNASGSGGVTFVGRCNYAIAAVGVNTNKITYVAEGTTVANWPLASTGLRCAFHLADGTVLAFERAFSGSASAITEKFEAPIGGVDYVCYHATGTKLNNESVESDWDC